MNRKGDYSNSIFEEQFAKEILVSEKLRTSVLAAIFLLPFISFTIFSLTSSEEFNRVYQSGYIKLFIVLFLVSAVAFELGVTLALRHRINRGIKAPEFARYINAFVEISIPSVAIVFMAREITMEYALVSPAVLIYFIFLVLSTLHLDFKLCVFTGFIASIEYLILANFYIDKSLNINVSPLLYAFPVHVAKAVILFISGITAGFVAQQLRKRMINSYKVIEERNRIIKVFGQHVSPAIVSELLNQKADTSSKKINVCVMFLDIRDFTAFSEKRDPVDIVNYLNMVFEFMIEYVNRHNGIIHQLLGDGFMASFGAPILKGNPCLNAINASVEILEKLNKEIETGKIPPTRIGIGLHTGEAVAGTVGSTLHKEYKITGDVVNVAAHLEQLNKEYQTQMLISEEVLNSVKGIDAKFESLEEVFIKGRREPIRIYKIA